MRNRKTAILIGNGTMGARHRARFESCGVFFSKVLDLDAEKWLGSDESCKFLQQEPPDFVVIASPAVTHYKYARFFLERRIPVLLEKPLAVTSREAMELVDLSDANDTLLFVAQSECYNPLFLNFRKHLRLDLAKAVAASRAVGCAAPLDVKLEFRREHGYCQRCRDVDVTLDLLVHDISLFLNLFDAKDVKVVDSSGNEDYARRLVKIVSGEFAGVVAEFHGDRNSNRDVRQISVSFGRNGNMSSFDYSVSLARYTSTGTVEHIPDSLDNEHRFFLKLLAGACKDWARRALMNAAQSVVLLRNI